MCEERTEREREREEEGRVGGKRGTCMLSVYLPPIDMLILVSASLLPLSSLPGRQFLPASLAASFPPSPLTHVSACVLERE
eukprot:549383-Rhodomonas_salina.1